MTINLERRTFIASLYEQFEGNARKATEFYNEKYYPDRIGSQTTRRIWKENNLKISPFERHGEYSQQRKRRRAIETKNTDRLKYLRARGKFYK